MPGSHFVQLPVQRRIPSSQNLNSIHSHISLLRLRIFRNHLRQGEKRTSILRPSLKYRNQSQPISSILRPMHHLLACTSSHLHRSGMSQFQTSSKKIPRLSQTCRRFRFHKRTHFIPNLIHPISPQSQSHSSCRTIPIDQNRKIVKPTIRFHWLFKQKGLPTHR